jgi:hypothetical protein
MKQLFFTSLVFAVLTLFPSDFLTAQNIEVGKIENEIPVLSMDDATLTSTFAFLLKGATLANAQIKSATDSEGSFYYIAAGGQRAPQVSIKVAIILTQDSNGMLFFDRETGCEMECNASLPCTDYQQIIVERCKNQQCACVEGKGSCNARISFPK